MKALALRVLADRLEPGESVPELVAIFSVAYKMRVRLYWLRRAGRRISVRIRCDSQTGQRKRPVQRWENRMNRFQLSWQLFKSSLLVMQRDKRLLIFPLLTMTGVVGIALVFLAPIGLQPTGHRYLSAAHWQFWRGPRFVPSFICGSASMQR